MFNQKSNKLRKMEKMFAFAMHTPGVHTPGVHILGMHTPGMHTP